MSVNPLSTRHFLSLPLAHLTARLALECPGSLEVSYLCSSRSEAVEGALKLAHAVHPGRTKLVAVSGAEHGSTLGALSACGQPSRRDPLPRLLFEAELAPSPVETADLVDRDTAAVIVEPWPGGPDLPVPEAGWLRELAASCAACGALLIADESRSGVGVTGSMFSIQREGVVPDVLVVGGALGGSVLPLAGYVTRRGLNDRVYGRRDPTLHASTTGGNPAACVAGLATLEMVKREQLPARAEASGLRLLAGLRELRRRHPDTVGEVRGAGLFARVRTKTGEADAVAAAALERGLICEVDPGLPGIALRPPLLSTPEEIDLGVEALDGALATATPAGAGR